MGEEKDNWKGEKNLRQEAPKTATEIADNGFPSIVRIRLVKTKADGRTKRPG